MALTKTCSQLAKYVDRAFITESDPSCGVLIRAKPTAVLWQSGTLL